MNLVKTILVILNTIFGFIQIGIIFFVQPFLYWLYLIPILVGFVLGYKNIIGNFFKGERNESINLGILVLVNLAFFVLVGSVYFDPASNVLTMTLLLTTMMLATISDFEEFGKALGQYRGVL